MNIPEWISQQIPSAMFQQLTESFPRRTEVLWQQWPNQLNINTLGYIMRCWTSWFPDTFGHAVYLFFVWQCTCLHVQCMNKTRVPTGPWCSRDRGRPVAALRVLPFGFLFASQWLRALCSPEGTQSPCCRAGSGLARCTGLSPSSYCGYGPCAWHCQ